MIKLYKPQLRLVKLFYCTCTCIVTAKAVGLSRDNVIKTVRKIPNTQYVEILAPKKFHSFWFCMRISYFHYGGFSIIKPERIIATLKLVKIMKTDTFCE